MEISERYAYYEDHVNDVEQFVRDINGKKFIFTRAGHAIVCSELIYHQEVIQRHFIRGAL